MSLLKQLLNYAGVFLSLTREKIKFKRGYTLFAMIVVIVSAFIYPLPTLLLIAVIIAISKSESAVSLDIGQLSYDLPINQAIFIAIGLAAMAYALNYFGVSSIIRQNIRWQNALFAKVLNQTALSPNLLTDTKTLSGSVRAIMGQATRLVGAAALIGRLLSNGLYNAIVCLICFLATVYFDYRATLIVLGISIVFLPLYARYFRNVSNVRTSELAERTALKDPLKQTLEQKLVLSSETKNSPIPEEGSALYQPFYAIANQQYLALNSIRLLVAVHFFIVLAALIFILAPQKGGISQKEFFLFGVLIILIRAGTGLLALMGNLTRNYENLSELRKFLFEKLVKPASSIGPTGGLTVRANMTDWLAPHQAILLAAHRPRNLTQIRTLISSLLLHQDNLKTPRLNFHYCDSAAAFEALDVKALSTTGLFLIERGAWLGLSHEDQAALIAEPFIVTIRLRPGVTDARFDPQTRVAIAHDYTVTQVMSYADYIREFPAEIPIATEQLDTDGNDDIDEDDL